MSNFEGILSEVKEWHRSVGLTGPDGSGTPEQQARKVLEEGAEILASVIKRIYATRITGTLLFREELEKEVGDIVIALSGLCDMEGVDMALSVRKSLDKVKMRNWKQTPKGIEQIPKKEGEQ